MIRCVFIYASAGSIDQGKFTCGGMKGENAKRHYGSNQMLPKWEKGVHHGGTEMQRQKGKRWETARLLVKWGYYAKNRYASA
jgi:hypothetical protein